VRPTQAQQKALAALRFSAQVLIEREHPLVQEVAENNRVRLERVRDLLWFRTAVMDEIRRRERIHI
jgi:hypothetical protein